MNDVLDINYEGSPVYNILADGGSLEEPSLVTNISNLLNNTDQDRGLQDTIVFKDFYDPTKTFKQMRVYQIIPKTTEGTIDYTRKSQLHVYYKNTPQDPYKLIGSITLDNIFKLEDVQTVIDTLVSAGSRDLEPIIDYNFSGIIQLNHTNFEDGTSTINYQDYFILGKDGELTYNEFTTIGGKNYLCLKQAQDSHKNLWNFLYVPFVQGDTVRIFIVVILQELNQEITSENCEIQLSFVNQKDKIYDLYNYDTQNFFCSYRRAQAPCTRATNFSQVDETIQLSKTLGNWPLKNKKYDQNILYKNLYFSLDGENFYCFLKDPNNISTTNNYSFAEDNKEVVIPTGTIDLRLFLKKEEILAPYVAFTADEIKSKNNFNDYYFYKVLDKHFLPQDSLYRNGDIIIASENYLTINIVNNDFGDTYENFELTEEEWNEIIDKTPGERPKVYIKAPAQDSITGKNIGEDYILIDWDNNKFNSDKKYYTKIALENTSLYLAIKKDNEFIIPQTPNSALVNTIGRLKDDNFLIYSKGFHLHRLNELEQLIPTDLKKAQTYLLMDNMSQGMNKRFIFTPKIGNFYIDYSTQTIKPFMVSDLEFEGIFQNLGDKPDLKWFNRLPSHFFYKTLDQDQEKYTKIEDFTKTYSNYYYSEDFPKNLNDKKSSAKTSTDFKLTEDVGFLGLGGYLYGKLPEQGSDEFWNDFTNIKFVEEECFELPITNRGSGKDRLIVREDCLESVGACNEKFYFETPSSTDPTKIPVIIHSFAHTLQKDEDGPHYTLTGANNAQSITIIKYTNEIPYGETTFVEVPNQIEGKTINRIDYQNFSGMKSTLKSAILPINDNFTISAGTFEGFENFKQIRGFEDSNNNITQNGKVVTSQNLTSKSLYIGANALKETSINDLTEFLGIYNRNSDDSCYIQANAFQKSALRKFTIFSTTKFAVNNINLPLNDTPYLQNFEIMDENYNNYIGYPGKVIINKDSEIVSFSSDFIKEFTNFTDENKVSYTNTLVVSNFKKLFNDTPIKQYSLLPGKSYIRTLVIDEGGLSDTNSKSDFLDMYDYSYIDTIVVRTTDYNDSASYTLKGINLPLNVSTEGRFNGFQIFKNLKIENLDVGILEQYMSDVRLNPNYLRTMTIRYIMRNADMSKDLFTLRTSDNDLAINVYAEGDFSVNSLVNLVPTSLNIPYITSMNYPYNYELFFSKLKNLHCNAYFLNHITNQLSDKLQQGVLQVVGHTGTSSLAYSGSRNLGIKPATIKLDEFVSSVDAKYFFNCTDNLRNLFLNKRLFTLDTKAQQEVAKLNTPKEKVEKIASYIEANDTLTTLFPTKSQIYFQYLKKNKDVETVLVKSIFSTMDYDLREDGDSQIQILENFRYYDLDNKFRFDKSDPNSGEPLVADNRGETGVGFTLTDENGESFTNTTNTTTEEGSATIHIGEQAFFCSNSQTCNIYWIVYNEE